MTASWLSPPLLPGDAWSQSLSEEANGLRVCAICGQPECHDDPRETRDAAPVHAVDEPKEEVR